MLINKKYQREKIMQINKEDVRGFILGVVSSIVAVVIYDYLKKR